jgi:hypothetical protein
MKAIYAAFFLSIGCLASIASAESVVYIDGGDYSLSGLSANVTTYPFAAPCINFYDSTPGTCGTTAQFTAGSSNSPQFEVDPSLFTGLATGTIAGIPGTSANAGLPVTDFITAPGPGGTVYFDLTSLVVPAVTTPCSTTLTPIVSCEDPNSPFVFTLNAPGNISVGFTANLCAYTVSSATGCTPYQGLFTSQFIGTFNGSTPVTLANLLTAVESSVGISNTVSASLSPIGAPEPGTSLLMLGAGLMAVAGTIFMRRKRT